MCYARPIRPPPPSSRQTWPASGEDHFLFVRGLPVVGVDNASGGRGASSVSHALRLGTNWVINLACDACFIDDVDCTLPWHMLVGS